MGRIKKFSPNDIKTLFPKEKPNNQTATGEYYDGKIETIQSAKKKTIRKELHFIANGLTNGLNLPNNSRRISDGT